MRNEYEKLSTRFNCNLEILVRKKQLNCEDHYLIHSSPQFTYEFISYSRNHRAHSIGWKRNLESWITAKKSEGIMNHIISQAVNHESWTKNKWIMNLEFFKNESWIMKKFYKWIIGRKYLEITNYHTEKIPLPPPTQQINSILLPKSWRQRLTCRSAYEKHQLQQLMASVILRNSSRYCFFGGV